MIPAELTTVPPASMINVPEPFVPTASSSKSSHREPVPVTVTRETADGLLDPVDPKSHLTRPPLLTVIVALPMPRKRPASKYDPKPLTVTLLLEILDPPTPVNALKPN